MNAPELKEAILKLFSDPIAQVKKIRQKTSPRRRFFIYIRTHLDLYHSQLHHFSSSHRLNL